MSSSTGLGGGVGGSETSTSRLLCDFRGWEGDETDGRGRDRFRARLALRDDFFGGRGGGGGKRWTQRRLSRRFRQNSTNNRGHESTTQGAEQSYPDSPSKRKYVLPALSHPTGSTRCGGQQRHVQLHKTIVLTQEAASSSLFNSPRKRAGSTICHSQSSQRMLTW
jgi:hypothetical protein